MKIDEKYLQDEKDMQPVNSPQDIPDFDSEDEEHRFWSTHYLTEEYIRAAPKPEISLAEKARRRAIARAGFNEIAEMAREIQDRARQHSGQQFVTVLAQLVERLASRAAELERTVAGNLKP